ncbi:hypothetical protein BBW65_05765 [Helicobacter enhydrae]|uniref:Uncharacterized protein n=1 Tax=Helicobacter enhydrae TaxID=222136 RepID=A0A1B1U6H0_9HELI|nr:hypothetical protein [Helicobacter enhydrae]ANV98336.1 hypothetical protein BBW65_05765 [Helicobacter enhydrae]
MAISAYELRELRKLREFETLGYELKEAEKLKKGSLEFKKMMTDAEYYSHPHTKQEVNLDLVPYNGLTSALSVIANIPMIRATLKNIIKNAKAIENLSYNNIPPVIPYVPMFAQTKNEIYDELTNNRYGYILNIDYNYFIYNLSEFFTPESRLKFIQDFRLVVGEPNPNVRVMSALFEFGFGISYFNSRVGLKAVSSKYTKKSEMNYYSSLIIQKKSDTKEKDVVQMNCIAFKKSFIETFLQSSDAEEMKVVITMKPLIEMTQEVVNILATTLYGCNEYWIFRALKKAGISQKKFKETTSVGRRNLLKSINIEKRFYS